MDTSITHIRPRFRFVLKQRCADLIQRFESALISPPNNITGHILHDLITLDIARRDQHYWSPHMTFRIEKDPEDDQKSVMSGLIGPRPPVWTMFMFIYFSCGVIGFGISSFGVSKWMLGNYSHMVWAFPISILMMLTAYKAGKFGEQLGKDQIEDMKNFVRTVVNH